MGQGSYTRAYDCSCYCIMHSCIMLLKDLSSNWVMPLKHSNISDRTCSLGKEVIERWQHVVTCLMDLARWTQYLLLQEDSDISLAMFRWELVLLSVSMAQCILEVLVAISWWWVSMYLSMWRCNGADSYAMVKMNLIMYHIKFRSSFRIYDN